jgi:hypothetical protein
LHDLPSFPYLLPYGRKRKRDRETDLENRRDLLSLLGATSPSLLMHGGVGLDCVRGHARAHVKPYE